MRERASRSGAAALREPAHHPHPEREWTRIYAVALVLVALVAVPLLVREQGAAWAWRGVACAVGLCAALCVVWRAAERVRAPSGMLSVAAAAVFVALAFLGRRPDEAGVVHVLTRVVLGGTWLWFVLTRTRDEFEPVPDPVRVASGDRGTIRATAYDDWETTRSAWLSAAAVTLAAMPLLIVFAVSDSRALAYGSLALLMALLVVAFQCLRGSEWARIVGGLTGISIGAVLIANPELLQYSWRSRWRLYVGEPGPILLGFYLLGPTTRIRFREVREARERIRRRAHSTATSIREEV